MATTAPTPTVYSNADITNTLNRAIMDLLSNSYGGLNVTDIGNNLYQSTVAPMRLEEERQRKMITEDMAKRGMADSGVRYGALSKLGEYYAPQYEAAARDAGSNALNTVLTQGNTRLGMGLQASQYPLEETRQWYALKQADKGMANTNYWNQAQLDASKNASNASGIGSIVGLAIPVIGDLLTGLFKKNTTSTPSSSYKSPYSNSQSATSYQAY